MIYVFRYLIITFNRLIQINQRIPISCLLCDLPSPTKTTKPNVLTTVNQIILWCPFKLALKRGSVVPKRIQYTVRLYLNKNIADKSFCICNGAFKQSKRFYKNPSYLLWWKTFPSLFVFFPLSKQNRYFGH